MRSIVPVVAATCMLLAVMPCNASRVRRGPTSGKHHAPKTAAPVRQRAIDDARATQIQGALVKAGYLKESTGHWDNASEAAKQKMQADNGWQTKIIPDSRALIKLGLGPNTQSADGMPTMQGSAAEMEATGSK